MHASPGLIETDCSQNRGEKSHLNLVKIERGFDWINLVCCYTSNRFTGRVFSTEKSKSCLTRIYLKTTVSGLLQCTHSRTMLREIRLMNLYLHKRLSGAEVPLHLRVDVSLERNFDWSISNCLHCGHDRQVVTN